MQINSFTPENGAVQATTPLSLTEATYRGELATVQALVNNPQVDIDTQDADGKTALMQAICSHLITDESQRYQLVEILLQNQASVDCKQWLATPLQLACQHRRWQIVELLIDSGANFFVSTQLPAPYQLLEQRLVPHSFHRYKIRAISFLQRHAARLPARLSPQLKQEGDSPLHLCCRAQAISQARILVAEGADPYSLNQNNESPLQYLSKQDSDSLEASMWARMLDDNRLSLHSVAAATELSSHPSAKADYVAVNYPAPTRAALLALQDQYQTTQTTSQAPPALDLACFAAYFGHLALLDDCVASNPTLIHYTDNTGLNLLFYAILGHIEQPNHNCHLIMHKLLAGGVNPNQQNLSGDTASHLCARHRLRSISLLLISYQANCYLRNNQHQTAIDEAFTAYAHNPREAQVIEHAYCSALHDRLLSRTKQNRSCAVTPPAKRDRVCFFPPVVPLNSTLSHQQFDDNSTPAPHL